jgi:hypothetical protein
VIVEAVCSFLFVVGATQVFENLLVLLHLGFEVVVAHQVVRIAEELDFALVDEINVADVVSLREEQVMRLKGDGFKRMHHTL